MSQIIDGRAMAREIRSQVKTALEKEGLSPKLAVLLVGDNPASKAYVRMKKRACEKVGIATLIVDAPTSITQEELLEKIQALNSDDTVTGILIQLPLPAHINTAHMNEAIEPKKDIDGFHAINVGRLTLYSHETYYHPCTPLGIVKTLKQTLGDDGFVGKKAVVVGQSMIVGRPTALMLQNEHCTVTMCDKYTQHLVRELQGAEILVSATGVPHLIGLREVQACHPKVVVIDAGFSKRDGKLMGDVDFHTVHDHVGAITPVPGGVGPMTVAMLTRNMLKAARANQAVRTISEKSTSRR